jgi:cysteinyl-tRNA synthetase
MHGAFLQISGGKKMAKSADNFLTLENALEAKGIDPLAYRYAAFLTHYRNPMEYSDESIQAAENGLNHLRNQVRTVREAAGGSAAERPHPAFRDKFRAALNDDLNMPRVMAVVQETLKADIPPADKLGTVLDFDRVLGFDLHRVSPESALPAEIQALVDERIQARREKNWSRSDELRDQLQGLGYMVQGGKDGMKVFKS